MESLGSKAVFLLVFLSLISVSGAAQWETETELTQASQQIEAVTFSSNENFVAYAAGSNVYIHEYSTWLHIQTIDLSENVHVRGLDFSPSDDRLAIEGSNNIYVYETSLWTEETSLSNDGTGGVDFSPDGNYLGSTMGDNLRLKVWNTGTWTTKLSKSDENWAEQGVGFTPDSQYYILGKGHGTMEIYDVDSGSQVDSLSAGSDWRSYDVDFTDNYAIHGNDDSNCYIYDSSSWNHERTLSAPSGATGRNVDISGDESWAGCVDKDNARIYVWSIRDSWSLNETFSNSIRFRFSNDGEYIAYEQGSKLVVETYDSSDPPLAPSKPDPGDREIVRTDSVKISAQYNGATDGYLRFYNAGGTEIGSCGPISDGQRCGVDWSSYSHGENDWYARGENIEGTLGSRSDTWTLIKNQRPSVDKLVRPDGLNLEGNDTILRADVSDPNSGDNLDVEFYNNKTGALIDTDSVTGSGTAEGTWSSSDQQRGEYNWWRVRVKDPWELDWSDENASYYVNDLPKIWYNEPEDGGFSTEDPTELIVESTDKESSEVKVYFYNAGNSNLIDIDNSSSGDPAEVEWGGLQIGNQYDWFVKASDGRENYTSPDWEFDKLTSANFRPEVNIEHDYSSIITSKSDFAYFTFSVRNNVDQDKNTLNTSLSGVNAYFTDSDRFWKEYSLEGGEEKRFEIRVEPQSTGDKELVINTRNSELDIETEESMPVHVRERKRVQSSEDLPGVGLLQLAVIALTAGAVYWTSL